MNKQKKIILASQSQARQKLLRNSGIQFESVNPRIDEDSVKLSLISENFRPREIADALAEIKAQKISQKFPEDIVLGCDQVLDWDGEIYSKPSNMDEAHAQLKLLRGQTHRLHSAAVIYLNTRPIWRIVNTSKMTMRDFSDDFLSEYVHRNWPGIGLSPGAYQIEEEGIQLFSKIDGDYFSILGLPILEVLGYLMTRGEIPK